MAVREILLLGNPKLYEISEDVYEDELKDLQPVMTDLRDTLLAFRRQWGAGRAISAPQIGVMKRIVFMEMDTPTPIINPVLTELSEETLELWDDCMSFPELLVRVARHRSCEITYRDMDWQLHAQHLEDGLAELLQHECDHLDGILAVARAIDGQSFTLRSEYRKA
ncbi:MAG: peptide deformylase [Anaerolineae bacterium]